MNEINSRLYGRLRDDTAVHVTNIRILFLLACCITLIGCTSPEQYAAERRQRLLEMYPPGTTTRADVQNKWGDNHPEISVTRPAAGWSAYTNVCIRAQIERSEERTGKPVYRCDGYVGVDGFLSLCWCWFYYDDRDHLVDAEWQYHSD